MCRWRLLFFAGLALMAGQKQDPYNYPIRVPRLERAPAIDGNLSEWKYVAFTDGLWDILRLRQAPWYDPSINRLTDHSSAPSVSAGIEPKEPPIEEDLQARYYTAWDDKYL